MVRTITRWVGLLALLAISLLMACGSKGVPVQEDAVLSAKIQDLQRTGGSARLRDLTGGDWDTVHIFPDPVSRDYVEEKVGAPIDMGHFSSSKGHILVFMKDGRVQRAAFTVPNNLVEGRYSDKVVLRTREQPGSAVLEVVDETG